MRFFLQNLASGRESQVCTLMPNFVTVRIGYGAFSVSAVVGPVTLTFDLLTLKRVHGSRASMVPNMGFRGLSVLDLGRGTGRTDKQTTASHRQSHLLIHHYEFLVSIPLQLCPYLVQHRVLTF